MPELDLQSITELNLRPVEEPNESLLDLKEVENEAVNTLRLADETENPISVVEDFYKPIVEEENQLKPFFKEEWKTQGKIGLIEQIRRMDDVDWSSRFPFSPIGALYTLDIYQATKRLQKDDYVNLPEFKRKTRTTPTEMMGVYKYTTLTPSEQRQYDVELLEQYFLKMNEEQSRGTTFGAKVFSGATYLPAWMIEFFLTGGLDQIGNKVAKETAEKMLQSYARTRGGQAILKATGWTSGVLTRATLAMPHRIAHEAIKRQIPKQVAFGPNNELVFDIEPESWETSIFKGWLNTVIEVGSEQTGQGITTGTKALIVKLPFGGKVIDALSKLRPNESLERFFARAGWSNLYGEIGEERLATLLHGICNTEDFGTGANSTMLDRLKAGISQDIQNFPVEVAVLSLPSGVRYVGGKLAEIAPAPAEITPTKPAVKPEAVTPAVIPPKQAVTPTGGAAVTPEAVGGEIETPQQIFKQIKEIQKRAGDLEKSRLGGFPETYQLYEQSDIAKLDKQAWILTQKLAIEHPDYYKRVYGKENLGKTLYDRQALIDDKVFDKVYMPSPPSAKQPWEMPEGFEKGIAGKFTKKVTNRTKANELAQEYKKQGWDVSISGFGKQGIWVNIKSPSEALAKPAPAKEAPVELQTESEKNQFTTDAAAVEATESAKQYLNQPAQEDISAEEPTEDDVGFIRNILHNLGIKDKGDYEPLEDKDFRDIYKFVQMPFDIAISFPQFSPIYETQRAREQAKVNLDLHFARQLQPYFQLNEEGKSKVNAVLCEADRNPVEVFGPKQLKKMGLDKEQIKAFLSVRLSFDESLNMLLERMRQAGVKEDSISDFAGQVRNYIPHKWYGNWVVVVQEKVGQRKLHPTKKEIAEAALEGRPSKPRVKEIELKRPRTIFMTKTNYTDRFKERERLQKFYPDNNVIIIKANKIPYQAFQESAPWAVGRMIDLVIEKSEVNPETAVAMREALSDLYKSKGFGMHYIKRKNIAGYTEDLQRPIAEYFSGFTGYITKMQAIQNFSENITAVRPNRTPNLYRYTLDYIKYVTGEQMEFAKAKRIAYFYYLFGNIKSASLNATQNFTMGWPVLSKYTNFALPKLLQAQARTVNSIMLTEGENQFLQDLESAGYLQPQLTQEISGYVGNPLFSGIKTTTGKVITFADLFRHIESFNRRAMAVALYDSDITDIEKAGKIIEEAHFRYGKGNRPTLARGYVSPVMVFRSWGINYFTWVKNQIKEGRVAPEIKSLLAITFLGGLKALPFAALFIWIWRKVFGTDPEAELRNALGEKAGQFVMRGAPSQIGISFTGSVSPMDIPTPADIDTFEKTITELGGVFADVPTRVGRVTKSLSLKEYTRALEDASPEMLRNPLAAYRLYEEGARSRNGRVILDLETGKSLKLTAFEAIKKAAGYQPIRLAEQYDLQKALDQFYGERQEIKQNWADRYWLSFLNDDPESMDEVTREIIDYNSKMEWRGRKEEKIEPLEMDDMLISRARPLNIPSSYMMPKFQEIVNKFYQRKQEK